MPGAAHRSDSAIDDMVGKHRRHADGEFTACACCYGAHFGARAYGFVEHQTGIAIQRVAGGRRHHAARPALEQDGADKVFEILDAAGQRRLADEDLFGGLRQIAGIDNGGEVAKMAQFHAGILAQRVVGKLPCVASMADANISELPCMARARQSAIMTASPPPAAIGTEIDGPGRAYFDSVVTDNIIDAFMELAAEVWTIRDRQQVLETVLTQQGIDAATLIEAHRPGADETGGAQGAARSLCGAAARRLSCAGPIRWGTAHERCRT